jgi:prolyl-tRNA synthetase
MRKVDTPTQKTCEDVAALLGIALDRTVRSIALMGADGDGRLGFVLALVRGDHAVNEIKLAKLAGMGDYRLATEAEIAEYLGSEPGFLGPVGPKQPIRIVADRSVAAMADFVVGANEPGFHLAGVNWGRDLPEPAVADLRNVVDGDPSPTGRGRLSVTRGIEVGHIFQLGRKYSEAMGATVQDEQGGTIVMPMGCYGIGVTRIVAAAIEQNNDERGIIWPAPLAPFDVVLVGLNWEKSARVRETAETLYRELGAAGVEVLLDDRDARPGVKFADAELSGIPHRVVVSDRGIEAGRLEYRHRRASDNEDFPMAEAVGFIRSRLAAH